VTPRPGDIWLADLDPVVANEQAGIRPVLVVSTSDYNALVIRHAFVTPITTRARRLPHHIRVLDHGGLDRPSFAMPEGTRAVSTQRFRRHLGQARQETVDQVRLWLADFLGVAN
jgi:mRNA interferase MazF